MNKKPTVIIPRSPLGEQIDEIAKIKCEMTELLRQFEAGVTSVPEAKVGLWRHDPTGWSKRHSR
jgi:hypothetical protein